MDLELEEERQRVVDVSVEMGKNLREEKLQWEWVECE